MHLGTPQGRALLLLALWGAALGSWGVVALSPGYRPHAGTVTGELVTTVLPTVALVVVAALLVWRVPAHGVTRVLTVMAVSGSLGLVAAGALDGRTSPTGRGDLPWMLSGLTWIGGLPMLPLLFLLFPTGRLQSRRWRPVLHVQVAALAALLVLVVTGADPATQGPARWIAVSAGAALVAGALAAAVGLASRWRRSTGDERAQLRVFALAAVAGAGWYVVAGVLVSLAPGTEPPAAAAVAPLVLISPALATGYAVARHHLYAADPLVNRFVVWGIVTAVLASGYLAGVALLTVVSGPLRDSAPVAALLAVAVAACLAPLRTGVQRLVDRAMYGVRDDPLVMLRAVAARLTGAVEPTEVGVEIARSAAGFLRLPWVALDLEVEGRWSRVGEVGLPPACAPSVFPIRDVGEQVGRLLTAPRRGERALAASDARVLGDLATQVAPAVRAARMLTELADSRERLVQARESERQRLRRDLHDSLSPAVAGIGLSADAARRLLPSQPGPAEDLLRGIAREARDSADVVRRMLADLQPVALEGCGLVAALTERARQLSRPDEFQVRVRASHDVDGLSPQTETAAFRIAVEAMTNAARHSHGRSCDVSVARSEGHLQITVVDDGEGVAELAEPGVGLVSMQERATEVGGRLRVHRSGPGTSVVAELPIQVRPR